MGHPETVHLNDKHWDHLDQLIANEEELENRSQALKRVLDDHIREYPHL